MAAKCLVVARLTGLLFERAEVPCRSFAQCNGEHEFAPVRFPISTLPQCKGFARLGFVRFRELDGALPEVGFVPALRRGLQKFSRRFDLGSGLENRGFVRLPLRAFPLRERGASRAKKGVVHDVSPSGGFPNGSGASGRALPCPVAAIPCSVNAPKSEHP